MKALTISPMHDTKKILLYLNHGIKNGSYSSTKKLLLWCYSWYIHKNMCSIRLYLNSQSQYSKQKHCNMVGLFSISSPMNWWKNSVGCTGQLFKKKWWTYWSMGKCFMIFVTNNSSFITFISIFVVYRVYTSI